MKRPLLIITLLSTALAAGAQSNGYVIKGTAEGAADGDTVVLSRAQGYSLIPLDTTTVDKGTFIFRGSQEGYAPRYIQVKHKAKDTKDSFASLVLENADFDVHIYPSESKQRAKVTGGPSQAIDNEFNEISAKWNPKLEPSFKVYYQKQGTEAEQKAAKEEFDSIAALLHEEQRLYILSKLPAPYCDYLLAGNYRQWDDAQKKEVLNAFAAKYPDGPYYKAIVADEQANAKTAVGKQFIDFTMNDTKGNAVSIGDIIKRNKYTLIDFWASWCGPCRAEMPHVLKAYDENHQKGFEVVGVSLDNKKEAWLKGIEDLNMPWQQMSDLKGWQCEGAALYNVRAIPANVLVRQDGTIVEKNLRGEKLIETVSNLLK